jgi:hypothetical protein
MSNAEVGAEPVKMSGGRFDIAYGAYCLVGSVALWAARVIFPGSPPPGTGGYDAFIAGLAFMVVIPLGLPAIAGLLVASWLSLQLCRDTWLVGLLLVTFAFAAYLFVSFSVERFHWVPVFLYGATCTTSGLYWFLRRRWRAVRESTLGVTSSSAESKRPG